MQQYWNSDFLQHTNLGLELFGRYDHKLVIAAILVCLFASFMALHVVNASQKIRNSRLRHVSLFLAAFSMAGGIWSMHFIALIALQLFVPIDYDLLLVGFSIVPLCLISWFALERSINQSFSWTLAFNNALLVTLGIASMHFLALHSMKMIAELKFDLLSLFEFFVVACVLFVLTFWSGYSGTHNPEHATNKLISFRQATSAVILTAVASGFHFLEMHNTHLLIPPGIILHPAIASPRTNLGLEIAFISFAAIGFVVFISLLLKFLDTLEISRANEMRLKAMMETAIDGIITLDSSGTVTNINKATEQIFGWSNEAIIGQKIDILIPKELDGERYQYITRRLEQKDESIVGAAEELIGLHKSGFEVPIRLSIGHVRLPNEDFFAGFITDISERLKMEQALIAAKENAERAAETKSAFLANMSHEIRTPMNAIIGFSEILSNTALSTRQKKYLNHITTATHSLLHLLNDILDSAKLEKGKLELDYKDFCLVEEIDAVVSTLYYQARNKGLNLEMLLMPNLESYYHGVPDRIRQVLINILGNAIKFTQTGMIRLRVAPNGKDGLLFSVTDTGIGIAEDRLETIFDPFTQADASLTRRFGGTGLGTSISKQLVELMGGKIWAKSTLGKGSCFEFFLPVKPSATDLGSPEKPEHQLQLKPLNILMADDVQQNLELLALRLEIDGHMTAGVNDGLSACALRKQGQYDLLLMDLQMPGIDGLQAAEMIRVWEKENNHPEIPIIALTASVMAEDRVAALRAGMNGFVRKPVDFDALYLEIAKITGEEVNIVAAPEVTLEDTAALIQVKKGLRLWQRLPRYYEELKKFAAQNHDVAELMSALCEQKNHDQLRQISHRVKGVSGNLAIDLLAKNCLALETACHDRDFQECQKIIDRIGDLMIQLDQEIEHLRQDEVTIKKEPVTRNANGQPLEEYVDQLRALASNNEVNELLLESFMTEFQLLDDSIAQQVYQGFSEFEFEKALVALNELRNRYSEPDSHVA